MYVRSEYLQYLVKVVDCGSMNKAAKGLFCTQPAISAAIRAIEDELGYPLIIRTSAGVTPTPNGQRVVDEARLILNYVDGWKQLNQSGNENYNVDVAYRGLISHSHMMKIYTYLVRNHPEINLRLHPGVSVLTPEASLNNRIGIVVRVPKHFDDMNEFARHNNLEVNLLYEDQFVLYINSEHPLAQKEAIHLSDLADCKIALPNSPTDFPYISQFDAAGCDYSLHLGDEENIMLAVARNLAITARPRVLATNNYYGYLMNGQICIRTIEDFPMPNSFYIIAPPLARTTNAERIVIDAIKRYFSSPSD